MEHTGYHEDHMKELEARGEIMDARDKLQARKNAHVFIISIIALVISGFACLLNWYIFLSK